MSRRIFIVEDEAVIAADLRSLVQSFGYVVAGVAHDAEVALERIALSEPDLVLMDIRLGSGADGVEVAGRLGGDHPVPVVYLTAHGDRDTVGRARDTLPFGYVIKPFEEPELRAAIEVAFARIDAEAEIRDARDQAVRALRELPVGAMTTDASFRVTGSNREAEQTLGRTADGLAGTALDDVVALVDVATGVRLPGIGAQTGSGGFTRPAPGTVALVTSQGRVPVDVLAAPIADDGAPSGWLIALLTRGDSGSAAAPADNPLSPREREVLGLLAEGLDARSIASRLGITTNTAREHLKALRRKLGANSQVEVLVTAIRRGLLT